MNPYARPKPKHSSRSGGPARAELPRAWLWLGCAVLLAFAASIFATAFISFWVGGYSGFASAYHMIAEEQKREIEKVLGECPKMYSNLEVVTSSNGTAHIIGSVKSSGDLATLECRLNERFGAVEAQRIGSLVSVGDGESGPAKNELRE